MKKHLLLVAALLVSSAGFAQINQQVASEPQAASFKPIELDGGITGAKSTKNGDTLIKANYLSSDTAKLYAADKALPLDSGLATGSNAYGDKGYAERFDIKSPDSTVLVLGEYIYFTGTASATSTASVNVVAWNQGPVTRPITGRPHIVFTGLPTSIINTMTVNLSTLRKSNGSLDSFRLFRFPNAGTTYVADSFFCGFTMVYSWLALGGDTIGVRSTQSGGRHQPGYTIGAGDTVINVQNATLLANGSWVDNFNGAIQGGHTSFYNDLIIAAMFRVKTTGVNSVTRNHLSVFGTYPNPSTNGCKLKLSLKASTTVGLQVVDETGRTVYTSTPESLTTGDHELAIPTAQLASGTYYCLVRTGEGDAMGIEMVVAK